MIFLVVDMTERLDLCLECCKSAHDSHESFVFECFFKTVEVALAEISYLCCNEDYHLVVRMLLQIDVYL